MNLITEPSLLQLIFYDLPRISNFQIFLSFFSAKIYLINSGVKAEDSPDQGLSRSSTAALLE